jgi:hypothetical protein
MNIDGNDGTVSLPNGCSISRWLSQDAFRQAAMFREAPARISGSPPWVYHHFSGGSIDGRELTVAVHFYDQMLVGVHLVVNPGTPAASDQPDQGLDFAAATKQLHDRLLEDMLGPPSSTIRMPFDDPSPSLAALARQLIWSFPWGEVHSSHDFYGNATCILVGYEDRYQRAFRAWTSMRSGNGGTQRPHVSRLA